MEAEFLFSNPLKRLRSQLDGWPCWTALGACAPRRTSAGDVSGSWAREPFDKIDRRSEMAVEESWIAFVGEDRKIEGYLALPGGESGLPAVVVIHEIWGLDKHIKGVTRRLVEEGYAALAPDLYTGEWREVMSEERIIAGLAFMRSASQEAQRDPEKLESALSEKPQEERDATKMLMGVMSSNQRQRFARELLGAVAYLQDRPEVDEERIGSLGFCM